MGSVKISDDVLSRLREHLSSKYKGKIWGKIRSEVETAITERLDRLEKGDQSLWKN